MAAYDAGQRHFGENYVDEFVNKAAEFKESHPDIIWHFIGHIQSNKAKNLAKCLTLNIIETIDTMKLATTLNKECRKIPERKNMPPISILIQVLTDDSEGTKNGVKPEELDGLIKFIRDQCPHLKFTGLMSMGAIGNVKEFQQMHELKEKVLQTYPELI